MAVWDATPVVPIHYHKENAAESPTLRLLSSVPIHQLPHSNPVARSTRMLFGSMSHSTELTIPWPRPGGPIVRNRIVHSAGFVFSNHAFCLTASTRCVNKLHPALASFLRHQKPETPASARVMRSKPRGIMRLVSRHKELEQRLARTEQQLRLLQRISRYLVRDMSLQDSLDGVVTLVVEFMECDSCLLYLLDRNELVLRASNTLHPAAVGNVKLALNEGLTGWVAREKRLLAISREAYHDPRFKFFSDLPEDTFEAFLSAPVISRRGVEGVINVQHREPHPHTGFEMELLTTVGEQVGCMLMLSRMEAKPTHESSDLVLSSGPERVRNS